MTSQQSLSERFSAQVRAHLAYHRQGQAPLAESIGVSRSTLSRRLNGEADWPLDDAVAAAEFFGYSLPSFLDRGFVGISA